MKHMKPLLLSLAGLLAGVVISLFFTGYGAVNGQMMGGGMMKDMPTIMQKMMGDALPPGIDPKLLPEPQSKGARLLTRYCAQCHNLPGPGMHTAKEWPAVVTRMQGRFNMHMRMMGGIVVPSEKELATLSEYLQAHALKSMDAKHTAELKTPAGLSFRATCTQCHALPDPKQHTAKEWPLVVTRMQKNIIAMGKTPLDETAAKEITGFLQRHGRLQE